MRVFKLARKESRFGLSIFMTKWPRDNTATGKVVIQIKQRVKSSCFRCDYPEEYTEHVLLCQSEDTCEL